MATPTPKGRNADRRRQRAALWAESQTEFEEVFDLALELMVIARFDGSIRRVNAAYERTLGYPLRELLSRPFLETV